MYMNEIRDSMRKWNDSTESVFTKKFDKVSDFIVSEVIPVSVTDESCEDYNKYLDKEWVFVCTVAATYKLKRKYIGAYTENGNDCLSLRLRKGIYMFIDVSDILVVEYEQAEEFGLS